MFSKTTWIYSLSLILVLIGALNWFIIGVAQVNLVNVIFGVGNWAARVVYILVGLAGAVVAFAHMAAWSRSPAEAARDGYSAQPRPQDRPYR